jgi:hypothetical protein
MFPEEYLPPLPNIHTYSLESIGLGVYNTAGTPLTGVLNGAFPAANLAIFIPFAITTKINVKNLLSYNGGTISGNIDLGIYDINGIKLTSTGSVAHAGSSSIQATSITPITLAPGTYYFAVAMDNGTGQLRRAAFTNVDESQMFGMAQMGTAFPLPATATISGMGFNYVPVIGLSTRSTV